MTMTILAFALGVATLQWQAALPATEGLAWLAFVSGGGLLVGGWLGSRWRWALLLPAAWGLGFCWAALLAQGRLADALDLAHEGQDQLVVGVVSGLPQAFENGWRFDFEIEAAVSGIPRHVSLAWYRAYRPQDEPFDGDIPRLHAGERWQLQVRLKRPHGNANPHGFDYEAWLFERGIRATGYVRAGQDNRRLAMSAGGFSAWISALRERVRARFQQVLGDRPYGGILVALAVGDQNAIDTVQWQDFARTGLTHLMSISGLHITLIAGLVYAMAGWAWRRSPRLPLWLPAQQASAVAGALAALGYCLLAGFAVPAQRTLYMLSVVALSRFIRRPLAARQVLAAALLGVLLVDPWAVLSAGFWLSFTAVALLMAIGEGPRGWFQVLRLWGRAQWAMTIGMLPLLLALFQQVSLVAPFANALAIPLVSFLITPLALGAVVPGLEFLLYPAHGLLDGMMAVVGWLARSPWAVWQQHAPPTWAVGAGILGALYGLLPKGWPGRWIGGFMMLPLVLAPPPRPAPGEAQITVLDVGQGLAVHVQTAQHDLLFDTGPAFSPDANSGNRLILPYLRAEGVHRLHGLVISHEDKDHAGGAASVIEGLPVAWLASSLPFEHPLSALPVPQRPCVDGTSWEWDGIVFRFLHPSAEDLAGPMGKSNDLSCVLRVETPHGRMLLTADIEARSETALLQRQSAALAAEVMLVPHHGSRTSSTPDFLTAVGPRMAVVPVGYRNRFGHPKADVVARYGEIPLYRTDQQGAVRLNFRQGGIEVHSTRAQDRRYWYGV